jgi:phosphoglycolate phosphatase
MSKIGIIFDMDGTLLDTLEDLTDAVNVALEENGHPQRTLEEMRRFVGNGAATMIRRAAPEGAEQQPIMDVFVKWYGLHCQDKTRPYEGIMEALEVLKAKYPVAVVSNKPDYAVKLMSQQLFPGVHGVGEIQGVPRKPAPDMVYAAMKEIGVEQCIYIGDSDVDLATAQNAGVPCISVLWGFRTKEELLEVGADCFCDHPSQLPDVVETVISRMSGT